MTREEARNELVLWRNRNSDNGYYHKFVEALTMAIKALEQEPILDKIIAEIEYIIDNTYDSTDYDKSLYNGAYKDGLYEALDIIDKYKTEKTAECDNNHDCEHCDWTECPLEVEKITDGESK